MKKMQQTSVVLLLACFQSVVSASRNSSMALFEYERIQLTSNLADSISRSNRAIFSTQKLDPANKTFFYGNGQCKTFPGDEAWPSLEDWNLLDSLTDGALLKPLPAAHVCYSNNSSAPGSPISNSTSTSCDALTKTWADPYSHLDDPIEMFCGPCQGLTCQPPSIFDSGTCTQGGYPVYTVNVSTVAHIQLAINFARTKGVRLVIKNTGHDFAGKSGGAGSLSIWTHYLKDITYVPDFYSDEYSGPAFKVGAGVQVYEIYAEAHKHGLMVVGGECPTVGFAGGYSQGGGHSPLSSVLGMAADQVLSFELVLASGEFVSANAHTNADLFWGLRGGGGGTFGVVTSMLVKAYPEVPVSTSSFSFTTATGISRSAFWSAFETFWSSFPAYSDFGAYAYFFVWPDLPIPGELMFMMPPFFAPNRTAAETEAVLRTYFDKLASLDISIDSTVSNWNSFYDAWSNTFAPEPLLPVNAAVGSRLIPRSNWDNSSIINATFEAIKATAEDGHMAFGSAISPGRASLDEDSTATNPAWRSTLAHLQGGLSWPIDSTASEYLSMRKNFTSGYMRTWRDLTPGSGAYLNEADRLEPNWQWSFYGKRYPRLLELKRKYDPGNVFYAAQAVGSEWFEVRNVDGLPNENGRLCQRRTEDVVKWVSEA